MKKESRLFSVPYNNEEPTDYINKVILPYKNNIENVFFAPIFLCISHQSGLRKDLRFYDNNTFETLKQKEEYSYEFLKISKGLIKRIITVNAGHYNMTTDEIKAFIISSLVPLIENYDVEGFICTDFSMACYLHNLYPKLELHTSCNCMQWNIRQMKIWQEEAGISIFNPPREILRTPEKLKEMHNAGFKIKALVNESCLYGCPRTINHMVDLAIGSNQTAFMCNRGELINFFKCNWVIPRWLPLLDKYVDIYKIAGRRISTNQIAHILKSYIELNDNVDILSLVIGQPRQEMKKYYGSIPCKFIPDKLLTCECKECNTNCKCCEKIMKKLNIRRTIATH